MRASILVVEDHPDLRAEILAILGREEYDCEGVSSGDAALLKIREHDYRYILLDVDVPSGGSALLDSCAANGTLQNVVLMTDVEDLEDMPEPMTKCAVLRKPFDLKQLLARVAK